MQASDVIVRKHQVCLQEVTAMCSQRREWCARGTREWWCSKQKCSGEKIDTVRNYNQQKSAQNYFSPQNYMLALRGANDDVDMKMMKMILTIMTRMFFELSYLAKDLRRGSGTKRRGDGQAAHRHASPGI